MTSLQLSFTHKGVNQPKLLNVYQLNKCVPLVKKNTLRRRETVKMKSLGGVHLWYISYL